MHVMWPLFVKILFCISNEVSEPTHACMWCAPVWLIDLLFFGPLIMHDMVLFRHQPYRKPFCYVQFATHACSMHQYMLNVDLMCQCVMHDWTCIRCVVSIYYMYINNALNRTQHMHVSMLIQINHTWAPSSLTLKHVVTHQVCRKNKVNICIDANDVLHIACLCSMLIMRRMRWCQMLGGGAHMYFVTYSDIWGLREWYDLCPVAPSAHVAHVS